MSELTGLPAELADALHEPITDDGDDRYCHTLDDEGRALCFADLSGRRVHKRLTVISVTTSATFNLAVCPTCGRETCPRCNRIAAELGRQA